MSSDNESLDAAITWYCNHLLLQSQIGLFHQLTTITMMMVMMTHGDETIYGWGKICSFVESLTQHQSFDKNSHIFTLGINPGLLCDYAMAKRLNVGRLA